MIERRWKLQDQTRGQSLVEISLLLPIILIILAGMVEVSNLLITQNRTTTAARTAAGFGAANYEPANWEEVANDMGQVALNTVTGTLKLSDSLWDIWSIYAIVNNSGDGFAQFDARHVFGTHNVISMDTWTTIESSVQSDMLSELQATGLSSSSDLEVVASVAYHNIDTILGLPMWRWLGLKTVRGFTVMRVAERPPNVNCSLLPISVRFNQYSIYPSNWPEDLRLDPSRFPEDPVELFPEGSGPAGFEYPDPPPAYRNRATAPAIRTDTFVRNWPGIPLRFAQPGYIYWAREEGPSGSFGWLSWRPPSSAAMLRQSLTFPGNYLDQYPGSPADMGTTGDPPGSSTGDQDGILEVHDWVENSTGNIASGENVIRGYVASGTPLTLIMTDIDNGETGENANYRVAGFVVVKLLGYSFQGNKSDRWILFEFVEWGSACPLAEES
ncbi:MAG: TadE/TadG family type IV pilus assembly protein [Chloroflexota bacterium]|jgi:Flp pilus assembly protein TadG